MRTVRRQLSVCLKNPSADACSAEKLSCALAIAEETPNPIAPITGKAASAVANSGGDREIIYAAPRTV
eukprot:5299024-Prymnesium_polylepis.1